MKREFSMQIFEKISNMKIYENPFSVSRVPCGRTGGRTGKHTRHDEANSGFPQYCERASEHILSLLELLALS
jgi:hypothetical protein